MKNLFSDSVDIGIGFAVNSKMDSRDVTHPRGVNGVVFKINSKDSSSVLVVTTSGIIAHGSDKKSYYIPSDRFKVLSPDCILTQNLRIFDNQSLMELLIQMASHVLLCSKLTVNFMVRAQVGSLSAAANLQIAKAANVPKQNLLVQVLVLAMVLARIHSICKNNYLVYCFMNFLWNCMLYSMELDILFHGIKNCIP